MKRAWIYILRCADGAYYTGCTVDLERRLAEHRAGRGSVWIRRRLPFELAFAYRVPRARAQQIEAHIKKWPRARKERLIARDPMQIAWLKEQATLGG